MLYKNYAMETNRGRNFAQWTPVDGKSVRAGIKSFQASEELVIMIPVDGLMAKDALQRHIPVHLHSIASGMRLPFWGFQLKCLRSWRCQPCAMMLDVWRRMDAYESLCTRKKWRRSVEEFNSLHHCIPYGGAWDVVDVSGVLWVSLPPVTKTSW